MMRQLLRANADNNPAFISEVLSLLAEIRSAWVAIGPEVRQMTRATPPSA
jgi:flagellin-specific chaperone FliS